MNTRLTAVAVGVALALIGAGTAHATQNTVQIRMNSTSTTCDGTTATIHASVHNDTTSTENVSVYLEPTSGGNTLGVPITSDRSITGGGALDINLPYENGDAIFMAVAVASGGTTPVNDQELVTQRNAGAANFSELTPAYHSGQYHYPAAPAACSPAPPNQCPPNWPINPYPLADPCPSATSTNPNVAPLKTSPPPVAHQSPKAAVSITPTHPRATHAATTTAPAVVSVKKPTPTSTASASPSAPVPVTHPTATATVAKEADTVPTQISSMSRTGSPLQLPLALAVIAGAFAVGCVLVARRGRRN